MSDVTHRATEGNPRKRRKVSSPIMAPSAGSPSGVEMASTCIKSSEPIVDAPVQAPIVDSASCPHEGTLKALGTDLDAMRDLLTCKICLRLHYEPYTLLCGHTFCYSCLSRWMNQAKATCPECRTAIKEEPHPSYVVRELVLVFMGRSELLAEGETTEKHHEYAREEAEAVALDRANQDPRTGGLFKGVFRRRANRLMAIRDHEDNVWRCPECHHELEDQWCIACNDRVYYDSEEDEDENDLFYDDSDSISEELDHDLELEDDVGFGGGENGYPFADVEAEEDDDDVEEYLRHRDLMHAIGRADEGESISSDDSDEEGEEHDEEEEEEQDPEMDSFIVNDDDEVEYEGEPTSEDVHTPSIITVVDDADEEDDDDSPVITHQRRARPMRTILSDSDDDDNAEGEDDVRGSLPSMRVAFRDSAEQDSETIDSDDDNEDAGDDGDSESDEGTEHGDSIEHDLDDDDDDDDDEDSSQNGVPSSSAAGEGFSPLQHSMRTGYDYYDNENEDDDDDEDDHDQGWSEGAARWGSSTSSGDHFNTHWRQSAAGIRRAAPPHPFQLANVLANVNHGVHLGQESLARTRDLLPRSAAGREVFWSLEEDGQSHDPDASDSSQTLRGHDEEVSEDYESDIG